MKNNVSKIEIAFTALLFLVACAGIGVTLHRRVEKGSGQLTTANYTQYMQVSCKIGGILSGGSFDGEWVSCDYSIDVSAQKYYALENVRIAYSLKSDGADLPDGTLFFSIRPGKTYSETHQGEFFVSYGDGALWNGPSLSIVVKSVSGTYRYAA